MASCRTSKTATWKEYVVSYRIWGWKDEIVDNVEITEKLNDTVDIDKNISMSISESPKSCNYNEKIYVPDYDENNVFHWKLTSDRQHSKSGSSSKSINSNVDETKKLSSNKTGTLRHIRRNTFVVLLENTISIDFHRITTEHPKYDVIKQTILEYEKGEGLDLSKVGRVVVIGLHII